MLHKIRTSLKFKLFLLFFIMNLSGILLVGFFSYRSKRSALVEQAQDSLLIIATQLAGKVDMFLNERQVDMRALASYYATDKLKACPSSHDGFISQYLAIYPYFERLRFINIEDVAKPVKEDTAPSGYDGTWYLPAMKGALISSDMYVSPITGRPTMSFAAPVMGQQGQVVCVMIADLKLDYLWDIIDSVGRENRRNGLTGYAFLVNNNGLIIAHPQRELVFRMNLFTSRDRGVIEMVGDMVKGRAGTASYTHNGVAKIAAYAPCMGYGDYKGHGWSLAVTKDYSELFYPMKRLLYIYLALLAVTSMAVLVVSSLLANYLIKPILALKAGASKVGAGNFGLRIETTSLDEIGDLARSFNLMAEALEARDHQLKEHTLSLTRMNKELQTKQEQLSNANQTLQKTNEELVKLEKQKAEWRAMITHDIKSPLSTILSYAEMILDGTVSSEGDELRKAVSGIHASGYKILSLVDNYLVSSAIEAGKLLLNLQPLDINELIEDDLPYFAPQAEKKNITLTLKRADGLPKVLADKVQLDRAISNIVGNAVKYSPVNSEIIISTHADEEGVAVSVTDKGRGISEDDMKNLFTKYGRSKATAKVAGTGLGLFISKAITEAHGGRITVQSKVGEGSTFTIQLPKKVR